MLLIEIERDRLIVGFIGCLLGWYIYGEKRRSLNVMWDAECGMRDVTEYKGHCQYPIPGTAAAQYIIYLVPGIQHPTSTL